jgi:hypothetical protein
MRGEEVLEDGVAPHPALDHGWVHRERIALALSRLLVGALVGRSEVLALLDVGDRRRRGRR